MVHLLTAVVTAETSSNTVAVAAAVEAEVALPVDEEAEVVGAPDKASLLTRHYMFTARLASSLI